MNDNALGIQRFYNVKAHIIYHTIKDGRVETLLRRWAARVRRRGCTVQEQHSYSTRTTLVQYKNNTRTVQEQHSYSVATTALAYKSGVDKYDVPEGRPI